MDIYTLCQKIELQPSIKKQVFSFVENFDFQIIDELQKGYLDYNRMNEALLETQTLLGDDKDGIKILSCMLKASVAAYKLYQEKGIPDEIFVATMKCFTRFINETYKMTGKLCFDRYWWTTRQVGCHLYRIGELEYEIKDLDHNGIIGIHIPSDAVFSPSVVEKSLKDACAFFKTNYPSLSNAAYHCHSWLLDSQLKNMLNNDSNILNFQDRFEIFDMGEVGVDFMRWLYNTETADYDSLSENTTLQMNVKKHLISGGVIRNSYGKLYKNYSK